MKLIYHPNKLLSKQLTHVDIENPVFDPKELKNQMIDIMLSNKGIGLAANQIGIDANVFVMGDSVKNSSMCINPTVLQYTEETNIDTEGCLSFPGIYVSVKRPKEILAEYYDENLQKQITKISGYSARCYLHELDHTLGITFKDRVSKIKWDIAQRKSKKIWTLI
jgi:peptide deformylase